MKTRVISAAVGIALFAVVLAISLKYAIVICICLAVLAAIAAYEMLRNTKIVKCPAILIASMAFAFLGTLVFTGYIPVKPIYAVVFYFLTIAVISLCLHNIADTGSIFAGIAVPVMLSYAFASIYLLFAVKNANLIFFILTFVFAWGADTGAYFAGTFFGKHKLAPEISPKKTLEGSTGGILGSLVLTLIISLIYELATKITVNWLELIIASVLFAVVGMVGDLFTSLIKRQCGIKDYGNIMPGHGGVMDRFDSVLLIAPLFYCFLEILKII